MGGRERRRRKETRRYWKLKEEALARTVWQTRFGRGYGPVVRQTAECTAEDRHVAICDAMLVLGINLYLEHWYEVAWICGMLKICEKYIPVWTISNLFRFGQSQT